MFRGRPLQQRLQRRWASLLAAATLIMLAGCDDLFSSRTTLATTPLSAQTLNASLRRQQAELTSIAAANARHVAQLQTAVEAFLASPADAGLADARAAWRQAHDSYSMLVGMAALNPQDTRFFAVDAWPIQPGYLDSQPDHPNTGLIFDDTLEISLATLQQQHGFTDPQEVSLGFHALEYLLFARPLTDFQTAADAPVESSDGTDAIARRRSMVTLLTQQLQADLMPLQENLASAREDIDNDAMAGAAMAELADTAFRVAAQTLQAFSNTTVEPGHGHYSGSEDALLHTYLQTTQAVWFAPVNLAASLPAAASRHVDVLQETLTQARELAGKDPIDIDGRAQMTLLLATLHHELQAIHATLTVAPAGADG